MFFRRKNEVRFNFEIRSNLNKVEEKNPKENFRVVSEMRILAEIKLDILDFVGYVEFF